MPNWLLPRGDTMQSLILATDYVFADQSRSWMNSVPGMLLHLASGYPLYALGTCFMLALLFRRKRYVFALSVIAPLMLFTIFTFPSGRDADAVFWAVVIYVLAVVGGVLGTLLAIPIRHAAIQRGFTYYY
jgi:hypothetical protein